MTRPPHLALLCLVALAGCGGNGSGGGTNPWLGTLQITSAAPGGATTCATTHTVRFTASGVAPTSVTAAGGDCVAFENQDTAPHQPASNPHPTHTQCPELNAPGPLTQGMTFTTAVLSGPKTCGWHDHLNPPATGTGGGYGY